jgi:hypothetical protein
MPAELSPEAQRLYDARKAAIEELRAIDNVERSVSDPYVIRLANARMFEESVTLRIISGESVTASEVKAGADMVEAARAALPPVLPEVKLTIVSRTTVECPECHCRFDTRDHKPIKPVEPVFEPSKPLATTPSQKERTSDDGKPATSDPKQAASPEQPRYASIHDHPGARMAPSITHQLASHLSGSMFVSPVSGPDWSAAHLLPTPPPECFK